MYINVGDVPVTREEISHAITWRIMQNPAGFAIGELLY